ncbi:alanine racemase [Acidocella sp.]|jgi:alanine racemase|uniref:alanine racemase n=1 Tax=Acidocella sp. TaxID=50710 RepID=UPI002F42FED2
MTALLEIDLDAIAANWRALDAMHAGQTAGVVKADAYGLGATHVAPKLLAIGCRHFFTAHLSEALTIRVLLPGAMLAVLNGILSGEAAEFSARNIVPVCGALHELAVWRAEARRRGEVLPVILHVDTGMARLGFSGPDLARLGEDATLLEGMRVDYVMTHLACADAPEDPMNARQAAAFAAAARQFPGAKTSFANSSGMFLAPEFGSDLARPGAALYGIDPSSGGGCKNPMRGVVRLSAPILQIHEVAPGETVGYGGDWTARRPSRIATLGVGYADGFHRSLGNRATAYFDATPVPLVGRVSMDLTTFDITDLRGLQPGDRLTLIDERHGPDQLAREAGTNGYEILTSLGRRYQRRYSGA